MSTENQGASTNAHKKMRTLQQCYGCRQDQVSEWKESGNRLSLH
jgi:hypothetical protein